MALTDKLTAIANAVRAKTGKSGTLTLPQMATEISNIPTGITPSGTKEITANGTHDVAQFANASVNVAPNVTSKSVTANGTYNAADDNADGYSSVNVNVPVGVFPSGSETITANGTYDVTNKASAVVNVPTGATNLRYWHLNRAADSTSGEKIVIDSSDWLKSVREDSSLVITLTPISTVPQATVRIISACNTNAIINGTNVYGTVTRYNVNGNALVMMTYSRPISYISPTYSTGFKIDENGELSFYCQDSGTTAVLAAGSYIIVAAVEN